MFCQYFFVYISCVNHLIEVTEQSNHRIVFSVEEVPISRVEFIIRYCHGVSIDHSNAELD